MTRTEGLDTQSHRGEWPDLLRSAVDLNTNLGALPMVGGTQATLLPDYQGSIDEMVAAIDEASEYVHVEFYLLVLDKTTSGFFDALRRARERGAVVRVLFDHLSSIMVPNRRETQGALTAMGAEFHAMLPLRPFRGQWRRPDLRNHRKLVVIDGRVGFTGSLNLIDSSYLKKKNIARGLHWRELIVRLTGPVVRELDAVFLTDWYSESEVLLPLDTAPITFGADDRLLDAQVLPSWPSFDNDNNLELFVSAIGDQVLVYHAHRSYYEALLRAGVKIYLYRAPTVLHSKHFSVDDEVAIIGSSNMDIRSFSLNMEVSVLVHGRDFVDAMKKIEDDYRAKSDRLKLDTWLARPSGGKIRDSLARLTASLQ
mgnify:CR=1 FL=1